MTFQVRKEQNLKPAMKGPMLPNEFKGKAPVIVLSLAALLVAGCTTTVTYNPSYINSARVSGEPRYQGKLLVFTEPSDDNYVYHGAAKSVTGFVRTMNVPLGKMARDIAGEIYGHMFGAGYGLGHSLDSNNPGRFSAIIHPKIGDFAWRFNQAKNAGFAITPQVKMTLNLRLLQGTNTVAFERKYESGWVDGPTYVMNFTPMELVNEAIHKTIKDLMMREINRLRALQVSVARHDDG